MMNDPPNPAGPKPEMTSTTANPDLAMTRLPTAGAPEATSAVPPTSLPERSIRERLGPVLFVARLQRSVVGRLWALVIAASCAGVLGFAAALHADPHGYGTHTQLGMPPCGMLVRWGYPCPSCGMTTAFASFAHGHVLASFLAQPMGFVLAACVLIGGVNALFATFSGRAVRVNWYRVSPVRVAWAFVVMFFGGWAFKMIYGLATGALPAR